VAKRLLAQGTRADGGQLWVGRSGAGRAQIFEGEELLPGVRLFSSSSQLQRSLVLRVTVTRRLDIISIGKLPLEKAFCDVIRDAWLL
jgi:hypothetical protein